MKKRIVFLWSILLMCGSLLTVGLSSCTEKDEDVAKLKPASSIFQAANNKGKEPFYIGESYKLYGSEIGKYARERFVVNIDSRLLVIHSDGDVWEHKYYDKKITEKCKLQGARIAANPWDKYVVAHGCHILVINVFGEVWAYEVKGNYISAGCKWSGNCVNLSGLCDRITVVGNRLLVINSFGEAVAYEIKNGNVGKGCKLSGRIACHLLDRFILGYSATTPYEHDLLVAINYKGEVSVYKIKDEKISSAYELKCEKIAEDNDVRFVLFGQRTDKHKYNLRRLFVFEDDGDAYAYDVHSRRHRHHNQDDWDRWDDDDYEDYGDWDDEDYDEDCYKEQ